MLLLFFFFFLFFFKIYLYDREEDAAIAGADAGQSWDLHPGLPWGQQGPRHISHHQLPPRVHGSQGWSQTWGPRAAWGQDVDSPGSNSMTLLNSAVAGSVLALWQVLNGPQVLCPQEPNAPTWTVLPAPDL